MKIQSINPSTGELIQEFESTPTTEIKIAVNKARKAQAAWVATAPKHRISKFKKLQQIIETQTQTILQLMLEEAGKLIPDGEAEVFDVIDAMDYYSKELLNLKTDTSLMLNSDGFPATDLTIDYVPHGVVGLIMPWNFPFYSPFMFVIANITAGNTVILKPSEYSTLVGLKIGEIFETAGFPEDILTIIPGDESTGKALVKAGCDKLFFVGSVEAGQDIMRNAGITPVQVELGGNSAAIVLSDADIDLAVAGTAWGGTYHSGQDCVGVKRVFVHQAIAAEFIDKLVNTVKHLRPGIDYGPYIRDHARLEVEKRLNEAQKVGAALLYGGERINPNGKKGFWLSPSVIRYSDPSIKLVSEETFGNVLPVMVVKNDEEAIKAANHTHYGLSNSVFTKDLAKAKKLAMQLESGMVFVNDPFIAIPGWDHWTGWKDSGFGTTESKLMQCLKKKVISVNKKSTKRSFWYPYN